MWLVLGIIGVLFVVHCHGQMDNNIFDEHMGLPNEEEEPIHCDVNKYCVHPSLCTDGDINESGNNLIGPRAAFQSCGVDQVCCRLSSETAEKMVALPCGTRNLHGVGDDYRDQPNEAEFGEFPWVLKLSGIASGEHYGGASLIHPKIALTAAHSVQNVSTDELSVSAGVWSNNNSISGPFPHQTRTVSEKVLHERYVTTRYGFDIALLILSSAFELQPHIGTVCLPPPNFDVGFVMCYGTDWGNRSTIKKYSSYLKKIALAAEDSAVCQVKLRKTRLSRFFVLHQTFMCATGDWNRDLCQGDGGSALFCPIQTKLNRYYQAGISSWGPNSGRNRGLGVYTSVPVLRQWVDEKFTQLHLDPSYYTY